MQDLLLEVHTAAPTTVLLVTHDVDEALHLADRVIVLGPEPGVEGATIPRVIEVPVRRPRDRGSAVLARFRASPPAGPGVGRQLHCPPPPPIPPYRPERPIPMSTRTSTRAVIGGALAASLLLAAAPSFAQSPEAAAPNPYPATQGGTLNIDFATYNP